MKNARLLLPLLLLVIITVPGIVYSQGVTTFKVISMAGYPDLPADTAYEGQSYSFDISMVNSTNIFINTTIEVHLKVDSIDYIINTNPQPAVPAGDTLTVSLTGYNFDQAQYKTGNNIVVVWPRVIGQTVPIDSFYTFVYFVPLSSLGDGHLDLNDMYFNSFPVPANDYVNFMKMENKLFDYVRIYSISGRLLHEQIKPQDHQLYIGSLPSGNYFVEAGVEGKIYRSKFIRE